MVAEAVAGLVLATKRPLPELPTAADCFREAESMRIRIRAGGGAGDQISTRHIWAPGVDGLDLRTIGNEMESSLRTGNPNLLLFWVVWIMTLDKQDDCPPVKERGPASVSVKQRKSLVWFLVAILKDIANEGNYLSVEERAGLFGAFETTFAKLGEKGRRDMLCALALAIQEHVIRRGAPSVSGPLAPPSFSEVRAAIATIDGTYVGIAEEARRYMLEVPKIVGLTAEDETVTVIKRTKINSSDKIALAFSLAGR